MRDDDRLSRRRVQKVPRHPEVDQENASALEPNNQILAAPLDCLDALAGELGRDLGRFLGSRQPRIFDLDVLEAASDEHGLEPAANRLDLGQLVHRPSLAMSRRGYALAGVETTSSRIGRACGCSPPMSYAARTSRTAAAADAS